MSGSRGWTKPSLPFRGDLEGGTGTGTGAESRASGVAVKPLNVCRALGRKNRSENEDMGGIGTPMTRAGWAIILRQMSVEKFEWASDQS